MDYELYDLALAFKKSKIWKKLWDAQLFAVEHSDGTIGYCCVMGRGGQHLALAVYPGAEGMHSYRMMSIDAEGMTPLEIRELAFSQNCVMVSFQNKSTLMEEEQAELNAYCLDRGILLRGQKACPQFEKFRPMHFPWSLDDPTDILRLKEGLSAALEVSRRLEAANAEALGFTGGIPYGRNIPLLTLRKGQYIWQVMPLPRPLKITFPSIDIQDDSALSRLKKAKAGGDEWAAHVFMHDVPVTDETMPDGRIAKKPKKAPVLPMLLMIMDNRTGMILGILMTQVPEEYAEELGPKVIDLMLNLGKPARILVKDERTKALFKVLCRQMGIQLKLSESMELMDETLTNMADAFDQRAESADSLREMEEQIRQSLEYLEQLPSLKEIPEAMLRELMGLLSSGLLSKPLADKTKAEAKRRGMV